jgi:hypothetical protein
LNARASTSKLPTTLYIFAKPAFLQCFQERFPGKAGFVRKKLLPASLYFNAISIQDIQDPDRPGRRLIQHVINIQTTFDGDPHHFMDIGHPDVRKPIILKDMQKTSQNTLHLMPIVVFEVMRAINGVKLPRIQNRELPRITYNVRRTLRIDIEKDMLKSGVLRRQRNRFAFAATFKTLFISAPSAQRK